MNADTEIRMDQYRRLIDQFATRPVTRWFTAEIKKLAHDIRTLLTAKSVALVGGVVSAGASVTASVVQVNTTALNCILAGKIKAALAAQTNADLFATAGSVGQAIYANGATAAAIALATDETAYVSVIAVNSDGAGSVTGDNGAVLLVAVVAGTSATYENQTAFLTDSEIADAITASTGVHAGTTGWVRLADILWDENSASPQVTITVNRDT